MKWALGLLLFAVAGCAVPIVNGADEADANRVVVALEENGIAADKEADPATEGRFRVLVARDDASGAAQVLKQESLPPPATKGVLEALGEGGLVPSRSAEHAKLVAGTAGDLERSLRAIDGVLSARVHLAVPAKTPFEGENKETATASVLIRHRGWARGSDQVRPYRGSDLHGLARTPHHRAAWPGRQCIGLRDSTLLRNQGRCRGG